jgi:hypothetical protein
LEEWSSTVKLSKKNVAMIRALFISVLLFSMTGCFQTSLFFRDFVLTSPGMDKNVAQVPYRYLGCRGPDKITLENERGVRATLGFEAFSFPPHERWEDYNLRPADGEALSIRAEKTIRDYFGSRKEVDLIVLKKVAIDGNAHSYLIDAKMIDSLETIGERLIEAGLARVDHDLAKIAGSKVMIKLEDSARRARRGIWQYASSHNPNWHD